MEKNKINEKSRLKKMLQKIKTNITYHILSALQTLKDDIFV